MFENSISAAAAVGALFIATASPSTLEPPVLTVGDNALNCMDDPQCFNRLHPDIPMIARALPGQSIVFRTRNASDFDLEPGAAEDPRKAGPHGSTVHPLAGPVEIEGARRGDALAVTIERIDPGDFGYTQIGAIGFLSDVITEPLRVVWRLRPDFAVSESLPGIRIPNRSFPGVVTVLPGVDEHQTMLRRERALAKAGGVVFEPEPVHASPAALCGEGGTAEPHCLRTIPPREHGGNLDIRYLGVGSTLYLPCQVDGCGLGIGDVHYAQGDGEVAGTAIEMDAEVTVSTRIIPGGADGLATPHFEGPSRLLDIPSSRFHATTGFPVKRAGDVPRHLQYLESPHAARLENLSKDISLAARNALLEMIDHISDRYGLTREQAYIVASVAVDLRIGQVVDAPNAGVTAILPLEIFQQERDRNGSAVQPQAGHR